MIRILAQRRRQTNSPDTRRPTWGWGGRYPTQDTRLLRQVIPLPFARWWWLLHPKMWSVSRLNLHPWYRKESTHRFLQSALLCESSTQKEQSLPLHVWMLLRKEFSEFRTGQCRREPSLTQIRQCYRIPILRLQIIGLYAIKVNRTCWIPSRRSTTSRVFSRWALLFHRDHENRV